MQNMKNINHSMPVTVSIIVPCYNSAPYVDACLESLVNQTLRDIEIICVNDASTDDTPSLLRAWVQRDSRIRLIDRENGGAGAARNTGMDAAVGEYIAFVDLDDYVEHSMYARLLEEARRHDADVTACGYAGFSDYDETALETWSRSPAAGVEQDVKSSSFHRDSVWMSSDVVVWNKLYRSDLLNRNGIRFETSCRYAEDDMFGLMLLPHMSCLTVIPDQLYHYRRQREGSVSFSWGEQGPPFMDAVNRLIHAVNYWDKVGWLTAALKQGWVSRILWVYLVGRLLSLQYSLPRLRREEWAVLHADCRECFALIGNMESFRSMGKWDFALCRLLASSPKRVGCLCRAWWRLLSLRRGRRGRYYEVMWRLSFPGNREQ